MRAASPDSSALVGIVVVGVVGSELIAALMQRKEIE
jgi:hypothetical protein